MYDSKLESLIKVANVKRGYFRGFAGMFKATLESKTEGFITCHVHDTGSLIRNIRSGTPVYYVNSRGLGRVTSCDIIAARLNDTLVLLDSRLPNEIFYRIARLVYVDSEIIREFYIKSPALRYKVDFMILKPNIEPMLVEVKGVNYVDNRGIALFPNAKSARASRQLDDLRRLSLMSSSEPRFKAMIVFIVLRGDGREVRPYASIDRVFASKLCAYKDIVEYKAYRVRSELKGSTIHIYYDGEISVKPCDT